MSSRVAAKFSAVAGSTLLAATAVGAGIVASAAPAEAAGGCSSAESGVTVIVQFPTGVATGCGQAGMALNTLRSAGFDVVGTRGYGDAALCGINGVPSATPCPRMPPKEKYWSAWNAKRGGSWSYSDWGVTAYSTVNGEVLAFKYGATSPPSVAVPAPFPAKQTPKPSTSASQPSKPQPTQTPKPSTSHSTTANPVPKQTTPSQTAPKSASSSSVAQRPTTSTSAKSSPRSTNDAQPSSRSSESSAAPQPTVSTTTTVFVKGKKAVKVTFSDGSTQTVAADSKAAQHLHPGVAKPGTGSSSTIDATASPSAASGTTQAPSSTSVPVPADSGSTATISTSGSVPLAAPAKNDEGSNLAGLLTGAGVVGVVCVGAAVAVVRRRG